MSKDSGVLIELYIMFRYIFREIPRHVSLVRESGVKCGVVVVVCLGGAGRQQRHPAKFPGYVDVPETAKQFP